MPCRRLFLGFIFANMLWLTACSQLAPSNITFTQTQIEEQLQANFPKQYVIAGLMHLQVEQPLMALLPDSNQIQTTWKVALTGPTLRTPFQGEMEVRFGLIYLPEDHSVRAQQVEVLTLNLHGANTVLSNMLQTYQLRVAQQALEGITLYTVPAEDLKKTERLGLQLGAITVTDHGIDIAIEKKSSPPSQP